MLGSKIFSLLLFVTLLLPLSAFATTAEEAFAEGNIAYAQNNYTQALERYSESIELNPVDANAYYNRGIVYEDLKDTVGALVDYDKAIELNPHFAQAYYNRACIEKASGYEAAAMRDLNAAIEANPKMTRPSCSAPLRPKRSPIAPAVRSNPANTNV